MAEITFRKKKIIINIQITEPENSPQRHCKELTYLYFLVDKFYLLVLMFLI